MSGWRILREDSLLAPFTSCIEECVSKEGM